MFTLLDYPEEGCSKLLRNSYTCISIRIASYSRKLEYISLFFDYPKNGYRNSLRKAGTHAYVQVHTASYPVIIRSLALHVHIFTY